MDICVYVNVKKVIRCKCVNVIMGGGGVVCASEIKQAWGGGRMSQKVENILHYPLHRLYYIIFKI